VIDAATWFSENWNFGRLDLCPSLHHPTSGWERRRMHPDFYSWLQQAVEDMIEHDQQEDT